MLAFSRLGVRQNGRVGEEGRCLLQPLERAKEGVNVLVDIPLNQTPQGPKTLDIRGVQSNKDLPALDIMLGQDEARWIR